MGREWYYAKGGEKYGPVSAAEIRELAATGRLLPDDLIWTEGMEDWVAARRAPGMKFVPPVAADMERDSDPIQIAPSRRRRSGGRVPRVGRSRVSGILDLGMYRYWTPVILRINWLTILAFAAMALADCTIGFVQRFADPSSEPDSVIVVPLLRIVGHAIAELGAARQPDRVDVLIEYAVKLAVMFYIVLWARLAFESGIVIFNIAEHGRRIEAAVKKASSKRRSDATTLPARS